ncbi:uncharacterized protein [Miscanthus floridulus]|uniref:uncharacterized protein n=1 Tax=Miscanthus floridulus TaxID=154761 RepID=UPI003457AC5E
MRVVAMENAMAGLPEPGEGRVTYLVDTFERRRPHGAEQRRGEEEEEGRGNRDRDSDGVVASNAAGCRGDRRVVPLHCVVVRGLLPGHPRCRLHPRRLRPHQQDQPCTRPTAAQPIQHTVCTSQSTGSSDRAWSCSRKVTRVTTRQPFRLRTEQRGKAKEENFLERLRKMQVKEERLCHPVTQGLPYTTDEPEIPAKPPTKEPTEPIHHVLHSDVAERNSFMEEVKLERESQQKLDEEIEIKQLRKE